MLSRNKNYDDYCKMYTGTACGGDFITFLLSMLLTIPYTRHFAILSHKFNYKL